MLTFVKDTALYSYILVCSTGTTILKTPKQSRRLIPYWKNNIHIQKKSIIFSYWQEMNYTYTTFKTIYKQCYYYYSWLVKLK